MIQAAAFLLTLSMAGQTAEVTITVHLRGVYDSKISLLALSPQRLFKPVAEVSGVRNGTTARIEVPKGVAPGECVLRFDYRETEGSTPYPSEKNIFINEQSLELWVRPQYCNNADSTWFQPGETENTRYREFSAENGKRKEKLGVLQQFLISYDDTNSDLFKEATQEYEKRRNSYNSWLAETEKQDKNLFISNMYPFQYIPPITLTGSEKERMWSLIDHYFDGMTFSDPRIIRTAGIGKWMDGYVNIYGQLTTTPALRDSLFPLAGQRAIEKARKGDPLVYGWMVDYFYRGYETNGIDAGIKILAPYLDDPNCLTSKRMEIQRRLEGIKTLVAGSKAPGFTLPGPDGKPFDLASFQTPCKYILVLFWSADCSHCKEMTDKLYPWQQQPDIRNRLAVVAVSLDETETEVKAWETKAPQMPGWQHVRAAEGVRSQVASDYFILATPVMVLLDAATRTIVTLPETPESLKKAIEK